MSRAFALTVASVLLLSLGAGPASAQQPTPPPGGGIFHCVDAQGRNRTADRPIAECLDREQRELGPGGTVRRTIEPNYTAKEQAERDERAREKAQAAARLNEERRRERALLVRYPNAGAHDRERKEALAQIDAVIEAARKRRSELGDARKKVDDELEFYKGDVSRAPTAVRHQLEDNTRSMAVQNRFLGEQEDEKRRVNARFDEERLRLRQLWSVQAGGTR